MELILIIILSITCLSLIVKHYLIPIYKNYKILRERRRVTLSNNQREVIKGIVREYLKELQND